MQNFWQRNANPAPGFELGPSPTDTRSPDHSAAVGPRALFWFTTTIAFLLIITDRSRASVRKEPRILKASWISNFMAYYQIVDSDVDRQLTRPGTHLHRCSDRFRIPLPFRDTSNQSSRHTLTFYGFVRSWMETRGQLGGCCCGPDGKYRWISLKRLHADNEYCRVLRSIAESFSFYNLQLTSRIP